MRMPDDSMRPLFARGDHLFVDPDSPAEPGASSASTIRRRASGRRGRWRCAAAPAAAVDLDDPDATPLRFAAETLSADAVTAGAGGDAVYHDVRAPAGAALASTMKVPLGARDRWYLRVDLDGMVFSATPMLSTVGDAVDREDALTRTRGSAARRRRWW